MCTLCGPNTENTQHDYKSDSLTSLNDWASYWSLIDLFLHSVYSLSLYSWEVTLERQWPGPVKTPFCQFSCTFDQRAAQYKKKNLTARLTFTIRGNNAARFNEGNLSAQLWAYTVKGSVDVQETFSMLIFHCPGIIKQKGFVNSPKKSYFYLHSCILLWTCYLKKKPKNKPKHKFLFGGRGGGFNNFCHLFFCYLVWCERLWGGPHQQDKQ